MAKDNMSAEERDILERFERGELRRAPDAERQMEIARQAARNARRSSDVSDAERP